MLQDMYKYVRRIQLSSKKFWWTYVSRSSFFFDGTPTLGVYRYPKSLGLAKAVFFNTFVMSNCNPRI